jgi:hypothetical protein
MPSKTPHTNGTDNLGNGINGTKDVEMKDDAPAPLKGGKGKKAKEGEEEMTVVVPPSKGSKLSAPPPKDTDGDVAMDSVEEVAKEDEGAVKVDPVAKAIAGMLTLRLHFTWQILTGCSSPQISRAISHYWNELLPCLMLDTRSAPCGPSFRSANASHLTSSPKLSPRHTHQQAYLRSLS